MAKSSPSFIASADTLQLVDKKGVKHFNGVPFSGKLFKQEDKSGDTLFIENYFKGLKHGDGKFIGANGSTYEGSYVVFDVLHSNTMKLQKNTALFLVK